MRKALVVGVDDYPTQPLDCCVVDATAVAHALETHADGAPNFDVRLITSPSDQVSRAKLRDEVEALFSGPTDIALLYFSGHGLLKNTGGYLVTTDAKKFDEGLSMDDVLKLANGSPAHERVVILDCCHSGAFGSPVLMPETSFLSDGMTVLTASRGSEPALATGGRSLFTTLMLDALEGGAADLRGHITPGSVYAYIDQALGAWDQRPVFKTNITRFTSLRMITPQVSTEIIRKVCNYFPDPAVDLNLDPSFEDQSNSPNASNVAIFKDLQKLVSVGLVRPVGEEHMYFAAMNSKACRLTALGFQYWRLAKTKRL